MTKKLVMFTQPGCGPCVRVGNTLRARRIDFEEVNIREDMDVVGKFDLSSTPTLVVLDGDKEVFRDQGLNVEGVIEALNE